MHIHRFIVTGMAALALTMAVGCDNTASSGSSAAVNAAENAEPADDAKAMIDRGAYLVSIAACSDCHTPFKMGERGPEPDMSRYLSGHPQDLKVKPLDPPELPWIGYLSATNTAFAGPWGITFSANLTPDRQTGLGIWTEEMFINAIRQGKHMGIARPIMPPMPWAEYAKMTDSDLRAVFAYLQSIKPITNEVPEYRPPNHQDDDPYDDAE